MQEEGTSLEQLEEELKDKMKKLYLPQPDEKTGIIPQFDGYFDLKEIDLSVYKNASVVGTIFHYYSGEDVQGMQAGKQAVPESGSLDRHLIAISIHEVLIICCSIILPLCKNNIRRNVLLDHSG